MAVSLQALAVEFERAREKSGEIAADRTQPLDTAIDDDGER